MTNEQILDKALADERKRQEENLVIDFDQSIESIAKPPITITYGKEMYRSKIVYYFFLVLSYIGFDLMDRCYRKKVYTVPGETPQWYMNIVLRKLHETKSLNFEEMTEEEIIEHTEVSDKEHDEIFRRLFGDEFVSRYLADNSVSKKVLTEGLLNPILKQWGWVPAIDTTEKKNLNKDK